VNTGRFRRPSSRKPCGRRGGRGGPNGRVHVARDQRRRDRGRVPERRHQPSAAGRRRSSQEIYLCAPWRAPPRPTLGRRHRRGRARLDDRRFPATPRSVSPPTVVVWDRRRRQTLDPAANGSHSEVFERTLSGRVRDLSSSRARTGTGARRHTGTVNFSEIGDQRQHQCRRVVSSRFASAAGGDRPGRGPAAAGRHSSADTVLNITTLVSRGPGAGGGATSDASASEPVISADRQRTSRSSPKATNLLPGRQAGGQVYVRDLGDGGALDVGEPRRTGWRAGAPVTRPQRHGPAGGSLSISDDGRRIAFGSKRPPSFATDTNGVSQTSTWRDLAAGTTNASPRRRRRRGVIGNRRRAIAAPSLKARTGNQAGVHQRRERTSADGPPGASLQAHLPRSRRQGRRRFVSRFDGAGPARPWPERRPSGRGSAPDGNRVAVRC